jgi:hypothetical protein
MVVGLMMDCQSEPVEDSRIKALPTMLRQATHDPMS